MRLTIKALGWIIALLWIVTLLLPLTVVFSLLQLAEGKNMGLQEPSFTLSDGNLSITVPFYVNNTGFYELSEITLNVKLSESNKTIIALARNLPNVPAGGMLNTSLEVSTSLKELFSKDKTLLTADMDLNTTASLGFRVAHAIAFNVAMNFPTSWGAPFHNLTVYNFTYNGESQIFSFSIEFENHAFFPLDGQLSVEIYNSTNESIGSTACALNVSSGNVFQRSFEVAVNPAKMTEHGFIRLYFGEIEILEEVWAVP